MNTTTLAQPQMATRPMADGWQREAQLTQKPTATPTSPHRTTQERLADFYGEAQVARTEEANAPMEVNWGKQLGREAW